MTINHIHTGDALETLKTFPDQSVDCCVTSPPYWGLRQYLFDGAVIIDPKISDEEKGFVMSQLEKHGISIKTK